MKTKILICTLGLLTSLANAQADTTLFKRQSVDSSKKNLNMDAVYNRPFLQSRSSKVALGGYTEANWQHLGTDGVSLGHQFQMRRMSIFLSSSISRHIKFLTEIEFENDPDELLEGGSPEVGVEYAAMDMELHPLLNLRGGIILNPIGAFNQNHDGPKWEFVDRPIAATQMLPATWQNAGFGLYGKRYSKRGMLGYEIYATGGFDNSIIDNEEGRTFLAASHENAARFATTSNGQPLITAKIAGRQNQWGEMGVSYMGGVYNTTTQDGLVVDAPRKLQVLAIDWNSTIPHLKTTVVGEWAWIFLQLPHAYLESYGNRQQGGFLDIIQPVYQGTVAGWRNATLNLALRSEYVDWNVGNFHDIKGTKGDELVSFVPAVSFRPNPQTVLRLNYRYQKHQDLFRNNPSYTSGWQLGFATYF